MNIIDGNIFDIAKEQKYDAICITTNGVIKSNGEAVMGAGIAKEATKRYKGIAIRLGKQIALGGNRVYQLGVDRQNDLFGSFDIAIISFPTKHHWEDKSDLALIEKSAKELVQLAEFKGYTKVLVPQPGVLNGQLNWEDVKKVLEPIFDERFTIVYRK